MNWEIIDTIFYITIFSLINFCIITIIHNVIKEQSKKEHPVWDIVSEILSMHIDTKYFVSTSGKISAWNHCVDLYLGPIFGKEEIKVLVDKTYDRVYLPTLLFHIISVALNPKIVVDNFNKQCLNRPKSSHPCLSTYPGKPKMIKK